MKVVLPGGSGQVGQILARAFRAEGHEVVVLSRSASQEGEVEWGGHTLGPWATQIDGADVVINLAGRSVNCRYTPENMKAMMDSRVDSTRAVGEAIAAAARPPAVWLQMSTATIYSHRFEAPNDEATGIIGGGEDNVPEYWAFSVEIAQRWEQVQADADTPHTRKVALRAAMVMSPDAGGIFDALLGLTRAGLGGSIGGGRQYVSWIHHVEFLRAIRFLLQREDLGGPVNLASPQPLPQAAFQRVLRRAAGASIGLPATAWMAKLGAVFLRTDAELILKSRRVVPGRLLDAGFEFQHASWIEACEDLVGAWRQRRAA